VYQQARDGSNVFHTEAAVLGSRPEKLPPRHVHRDDARVYVATHIATVAYDGVRRNRPVEPPHHTMNQTATEARAGPTNEGSRIPATPRRGRLEQCSWSHSPVAASIGPRRHTSSADCSAGSSGATTKAKPDRKYSSGERQRQLPNRPTEGRTKPPDLAPNLTEPSSRQFTPKRSTTVP
jgi:hypothetical protein